MQKYVQSMWVKIIKISKVEYFQFVMLVAQIISYAFSIKKNIF